MGKFRSSASSRWSIAALLLAIAVGSPPSVALASGGARAEYRRAAIQGVWDSSVTLSVCGSGAVIRSFRALNSFASGGSLVATSEVAQQPSLGVWRWLGLSNFTAQFRFQRFDASGVLQGFTEVTRDIEMDSSRDAFSSVFSIRQLDLQGGEVARGCGLEVAQRVF